MKITIKALKKYLDINENISPTFIVDKLNSIGLEVEEFIDIKKKYQGFIIASIENVTPHPDANKLNVCSISTGKGESLQVVCGASNVKVGAKVVLATVGTKIPNSGMIIKETQLRGQQSQGMLCSADELELESHPRFNKDDGIILLPSDAPLGENFATYASIDDFLIELSLTPNRRRDCASVIGIARDLAASGVGNFKKELLTPSQPFYTEKVEPIIAEKTGCLSIRFVTVENVKMNVANQGLNFEQISSAYQDIISFLVLSNKVHDNWLVNLSNAMMYEMGYPNHIYDQDKVNGKPQVRLSREGEKFIALGGKEYILPSGLTVIADDIKILSLAGVMGGEESKVDQKTKNIIIEYGLFSPQSVTMSGRFSEISSESRMRFAAGVDKDDSALEASLSMMLQLITTIAPDAKIKEGIIYRENNNEKLQLDDVVNFSYNDVRKIIGSEKIDDCTIDNVLSRLGFVKLRPIHGEIGSDALKDINSNTGDINVQSGKNYAQQENSCDFNDSSNNKSTQKYLGLNYYPMTVDASLIKEDLGNFSPAGIFKSYQPQEAVSFAIPSWRRGDISNSASDIAEEVLRILGIDKVEDKPFVYSNSTVSSKKPSHYSTSPYLQDNELLQSFDSPLHNIKSIINCGVDRVRELLKCRGYLETISYSMCSAEEMGNFFLSSCSGSQVEIANPVNSNMSCMRSSIIPCLIKSVEKNMARGYFDISLFEFGNIFSYNCRNQLIQQEQLAFLRTGEADNGIHEKKRNWDFFDIRQDLVDIINLLGLPYYGNSSDYASWIANEIESALDLDGEVVSYDGSYINVGIYRICRNAPLYYHPGRSVALYVGLNHREAVARRHVAQFNDGKFYTLLGYAGEIAPSISRKYDLQVPGVMGEIFMDTVAMCSQQYSLLKKKKKEFSHFTVNNYPVVQRDISIIVNHDYLSGDLLNVAIEASDAIVIKQQVFDVHPNPKDYPGKQAVGMRFWLQASDRTLSNDEVDIAIGRIISNLEKKVSAVLRGRGGDDQML